MRRGKEITQGSHASSYFMIDSLNGNKITLDDDTLKWLSSGMTKITTKVDSERELVELYNKAKKMGLKAHIVTDAGRTEFNGVPTKTALAIGPNYSDDMASITDELKLY